MDIHYRMRYLMGHETPRKPRTAPDPTKAGHCPASIRENLSIDSDDSEFFDKFGGALGPGPSQGRCESAPPKTCSWASTDADIAAEAPPVALVGQGLPVRRIHNRPVDSAARSQTDRKTFWDALSSRTCVAGAPGIGLDLPEAGEARPTAGRKSYCALEETRLAAHKKKPKDLGAISYSSTKADFSSSLMSAGPGRQSGRPRFSNTAIAGIGFPSSPASPCPHPESISVFTSDFTRTISPAWRSLDSCGIFYDICADRSCSFGTEARFTGASSFVSSSSGISGFTFIVSPRMLQSSIPMNSSGPKQSTLYPMAHRRILLRSERNCADLSTASAGPRNCCGPVSMRPIYHGHGPRYIHYLCECQ